MKFGKSAFTLVELLIVLVIISLLLGIVFLASGTTREKSKETVCMSNLKQLYTALAMYRNDYDGTEPSVGVRLTFEQAGLPPLDSEISVHAFEKGYAKDPRIMRCPATPVAESTLLFTYERGFYGEYAPRGSLPKESEVWYKMGGHAPMLACFYHNPPINSAEAPRWTTQKILILRFNGQVEAKNIGLRQYYPYEPFE